MQYWGKFRKTQKLILFCIVLLLMIAFVEQLVGNAEFKWSVFDFILAFVMLLSLGFGLEYLIRKTKSKTSKLFLILLITSLFMLLWTEMAVGIFNSPIAGK